MAALASRAFLGGFVAFLAMTVVLAQMCLGGGCDNGLAAPFLAAPVWPAAMGCVLSVTATGRAVVALTPAQVVLLYLTPTLLLSGAMTVLALALAFGVLSAGLFVGGLAAAAAFVPALAMWWMVRGWVLRQARGVLVVLLVVLLVAVALWLPGGWLGQWWASSVGPENPVLLIGPLAGITALVSQRSAAHAPGGAWRRRAAVGASVTLLAGAVISALTEMAALMATLSTATDG